MRKVTYVPGLSKPVIVYLSDGPHGASRSSLEANNEFLRIDEFFRTRLDKARVSREINFESIKYTYSLHSRSDGFDSIFTNYSFRILLGGDYLNNDLFRGTGSKGKINVMNSVWKRLEDNANNIIIPNNNIPNNNFIPLYEIESLCNFTRAQYSALKKSNSS